MFDSVESALEDLESATGALAKVRATAALAGEISAGGPPVPKTDTPEFKSWFSDSKVVNAEGKPLVVFHGTNANFDQFESKKGFPTAGYFAEDPVFSSAFAKTMSSYHGGDSNVMPVYLSIKNPFDTSKYDGTTNYSADELKSEFPVLRDAVSGSQNKPIWAWLGEAAVIDALKREGYDGAIYNEGSTGFYTEYDFDGDYEGLKTVRSFIAFYPEQIKSAIGNRGTFDPSSASILDSISAVERIRLTSQLAAQTKALKDAADALGRVRASAKVAELVRQLKGDGSPAKIRNFGWDAVKLADLSMEELRELRKQVEAEHANPFTDEGRYTENGQPTLHLYDKKGRKKLEALGWAVTYKLQAGRGADDSSVPADGKNRAVAGGQEGINGYTYKGGQFLPNTMAEPGRWKLGGKWVTAGKEQVAPGEWEFAPTPFSRSIYMASGLSAYGEDAGAGKLSLRAGLRDNQGNPVTPDSEVRPGVRGVQSKTAFTMQEMLNAYNQGLRWVEVEPNAETITTQDAAELAKAIAKFKAVAARNPQPSEAATDETDTESPEIIEHVTGKGKTLRGIVRTDLSYAQAKEIDPYTFKKSGGFFIRERHLDGYTPTDPAPKPELTPEQQAQAEADRLANEQLKQAEKKAAQVSKLREAAESTIAKAEEDLSRDRQTNTARRANMAANIAERNETSRAIGKTMLNLASAIESGEAKRLSGVTSRVAVETLHNALMNAMSHADRGLDYAEQQRRKGRVPTVDDVRNAKFPMAMWGTAGTSLSKVLDAIKGKRGAPALAKKIQYAPGPDAEILKELRAMVGKKEADYLIGWYNIEMIARADRLRRAGINGSTDLQEALAEYLQFREGARAEDPVKAAERAIIGQKVGLDFFPTPSSEAQRMVRLADIQQGERVLEPSAGNGNIADAAAAAGAKVDVIEISSQLRNILEAKGYSVVANDFMSFEPSEPYDAVLMNPPFSDRLDAQHIMRAFGMLRSGGRLVAIAGEGVFIGSDKRAVAFREWLEEHAAEVEQLPKGTFMDNKLLATTGANGRLLVMQKQ